ncbi:MAG TPA: anti-sigma factor [Streptosporangiaceae bacterium]|nr:anti-sigma factor [Streptosporangiaceae bacterium]
MVRLLRPDLHGLTGPYAVDALDAAERDRFEQHLGRCPSCEHEVRGMQETATRLAIAVAAPPPAGLKAAVLTAAAQTRQHPPVPDAEPEAAALPRARPRHGGARSRRRFRLAVPVAALATAAAITLGVTVGVQQSRLDQVQAQQHEVAAVLSAPDARIVSGRTALGGHTTMVVAASLDKMVFTAAGLPALAHARVYELWLLTPAGGAIPNGLLPKASAVATAPVITAGPQRGDQVAVTVEPAGGSKQPTSKPIVVLSLPA